MTGQSPTPKAMVTGAARMSKRILLSYVIDWILIIGFAAAGVAFNKEPNSNKRPFSLQDPSLTYPFKADTVSVTVLIIISLAVPAAVTAVVSLIFVPGPTAAKSTPKSLVWRRKLWEWNTAWMGLGLALALTFMTTEGLKDLAGKPRPYAISKCRPDLQNIDRYRLGGLGDSFTTTGATPILVSSDICQERDPATLREIFASWPSGHSSFSWAGLLYMTLFLCAKFAVGIPYFTADSQSTLVNTYEYDMNLRQPYNTQNSTSDSLSDSTKADGHSRPAAGPSPPPRNTAAAPPVYLLLLAVVLPIGTAIFVCVSRWFDFHHHGIDILSGAIIGAFSAYFSFRYYHMPIRRGSGWSWGARSRERAFWVGVGRDGYVGQEGWMAAKAARQQMSTDSAQNPQSDGQVLSEGMKDPGDLEANNAAHGRLHTQTSG